jgi:hypothetical protein
MSTKHKGFGKAFVTYFVPNKNINLIKFLLSNQNIFVNANILISILLQDIFAMKIFVYLRLIVFALLIFSTKCMTMDIDSDEEFLQIDYESLAMDYVYSNKHLFIPGSISSRIPPIRTTQM